MRFRGLAILALLSACQGETVSEQAPDGGASGGSAGSGATGGSGGTTGSGGTAAGSGGTGSMPTGGGGVATGGSGAVSHGPGPHGALPSGYCCSADQDCRYRTCTDFGGVKICSDPCSNDTACNTASNMTCNQGSGQCQPTGAPSCTPADQYPLGPNSIGACCVATGDGHAGEECNGNLCVAFGDLSNPFICTHACDAPKDCPPKYECNQFTRFCWPLASIYDCQ